MKCLGETNCLVFEIEGQEIYSFFEKFGEDEIYRSSNENPDVVIIKPNHNNPHLISKYSTFFNSNFDKADTAIIYLKTNEN